MVDRMINDEAPHYWSSLSESVWPLYHENSKASSFGGGLTDMAVAERIEQLADCLCFHEYPVVQLPDPPSLQMQLDVVITRRSSDRSIQGGTLGLDTLAALLRYSYGLSRTDES